MKVAKIAVAAASLLVVNAGTNLVIKKAQNSTSVKDVFRDAVRVVFIPAPVTYRNAAA